jgi:NDP-hexose 4-ketoreductase
MDIVGNGFLAANLRPLAQENSGVTFLAAGVPTGAQLPEEEYRRDARLVRETVERCLSENRLLVYPSTAADGLYGGIGCRGREDEPPAPISAYGRHKLEMEQLVRKSGARYLILRLGHVAGPAQPAHQLVPALISQLRSGTITVYRGAHRDLIDVSDVAWIVSRLLNARVTQEIVNVSSGLPLPVELIIARLEERLELTAAKNFVDGSSRRYAVSLAKLRRLVPSLSTLGFGPGYYRTVIDRYVDQLAAPPRPS